MPNSYSLTVMNNSELVKPTFAVFAKLPQGSAPQTLTTAWLIQQIDSATHYTFTWDITWGFVWSASGAEADYQWTAGGNLAADPNSASQCEAVFDYDGSFLLTPGTGTPNASTLWITDTTNVPRPSKQPSSVGVSLSGSPACVVNAGPNLNQTFTLHPTYYINAGNYVQGQMVDGNSVAAYQELKYAGGVTALTATLNPDNTWNVLPSSKINYAQLLADRAAA